jgi:hypothetical protein
MCFDWLNLFVMLQKKVFWQGMYREIVFGGQVPSLLYDVWQQIAI